MVSRQKEPTMQLIRGHYTSNFILKIGGKKSVETVTGFYLVAIV